MYTCTEYTENTEITIPDEYNGIPITRIGGYIGSGYPCPFYIDIGELYMNASSDSRYHSIFDDSAIEPVDNCEVEDLVFVLNIGKNI